VENGQTTSKKSMTNCVSVFPPGTIHAVWTDEDSIFCGGHFLVPQVMDRFVEVLQQIELDPSRTNDVKGVEIFRLLENFISEVLGASSAGLTRTQLEQLVLVLDKYAKQKFEADVGVRDRAEAAHMDRRKKFLGRLHKMNWISQLREKAMSMSW
jgi:hypothetical protein